MLLWHLSFFIFKDVFYACYPFIEWFYKFCFCDKLKTLNHQNTNNLAAHYLVLTYLVYWPWPQIFGINSAENPQSKIVIVGVGFSVLGFINKVYGMLHDRNKTQVKSQIPGSTTHKHIHGRQLRIHWPWVLWVSFLCTKNAHPRSEIDLVGMCINLSQTTCTMTARQRPIYCTAIYERNCYFLMQQVLKGISKEVQARWPDMWALW